MNRTAAWIVGSLVVAGGAIVALVWWQSRTPPSAPPPSPVVIETPPAVVAVPAAPAIAHPIEQAQVPAAPPPQASLDASDPAMRESLAQLFKSGKLPEFVRPTALVRNIVATIDNLPREKVSRRVMPIDPMPGRFVVSGNKDDLLIAPENAARYAPAIAIVQAIDTQKLVAVYVRFYPLFQQAYRELGYSNGYFNDRVIQVIDHLLATREVPLPIKLVQPEIFYRYADPELEDLPAGQKALIRIGPENAAKLKAKLREIRQALTGQKIG